MTTTAYRLISVLLVISFVFFPLIILAEKPAPTQDSIDTNPIYLPTLDNGDIPEITPTTPDLAPGCLTQPPNLSETENPEQNPPTPECLLLTPDTLLAPSPPESGAGVDHAFMEARYYDGKMGRFLGQDPAFQVVGTPALKDKTGLELEQYLADPQQLNSYSYVKNNPLKYKDPTGEFVDTILDVGFIAYDVYKIGQAYATNQDASPHLRALTLDAAGAAIPGVTGLGMVGRLASRGDTVFDLAKMTGKSISELTQETRLLRQSYLQSAKGSPALESIIGQLFRAGDEIPGGTAGALVYEAYTGKLLSATGHLTKATDRIAQLDKLITKGSLSPDHLKLANQLKGQLTSAVQYFKGVKKIP